MKRLKTNLKAQLFFKIVILLLPLLLLFPRQFTENIYQNSIVWLVLSSALLILLIKIRSLFIGINALHLAFGVYLISMLISAGFSSNIFLSTGIMLLNICYAIIFLAMTGSEKSFIQKVLLVLLTIISVLGVISFLNSVIFRVVNYETNGLSYMWIYWGHNHLASLMLIALPINMYFLYLYHKNIYLRVLFSVLLIFLCYSLLITFSRAAVLSLLIVSVFFILFSGKIIKKILIIKILFLMTVLSLFFIYVNSYKLSSGFENRLYHIDRALKIFYQNPLFGSGPGTYASFVLEGSPSKSSFVHNNFIQYLAETGVIGLVSWSVLVGLVIRRCVSKINQSRSDYLDTAVSVSILALLLNELLDFDLFIPSLAVIFWMLVGALFRSVEETHYTS